MADIPTLLDKAINYLSKTNPGQAEIWVASDLQRGDWRPGDSRWGSVQASLKTLPAKTKLRVLSAGGEAPKPCANFAPRRTTRTLSRSQTEPNCRHGTSTVPVTYSLKGNRTVERITLNGQEVRFKKDTASAGRLGWRGRTLRQHPDKKSVLPYESSQRTGWFPKTPPATPPSLRAAARRFNRYDRDRSPTQTTNDWATASMITGRPHSRWEPLFPTERVCQIRRFRLSPKTKICWHQLGRRRRRSGDKFFINGLIKDDGPGRMGSMKTRCRSINRHPSLGIKGEVFRSPNGTLSPLLTASSKGSEPSSSSAPFPMTDGQTSSVSLFTSSPSNGSLKRALTDFTQNSVPKPEVKRPRPRATKSVKDSILLTTLTPPSDPTIPGSIDSASASSRSTVPLLKTPLSVSTKTL